MSDASQLSMNLLQKYSAMNSEINENRGKKAVLLAELEELKAEEQRLLQEDAQMKAAARKAEAKTVEWEEKIKEIENDNETLQAALREETLVAERAERDVETIKATIAARRQAFQEESRLFREQCKHLQLEATLLGLDHACAKAFATVNGRDGSSFDGLGTVVLCDQDDLDEPPDTWSFVLEDDYEMKESMSLYREQMTKMEAAHQALELEQAKKQAVVDRSNDVKGRQQQLQSQLDRINKDIIDLDSQIREMERLAREAKDKGEHFSRKTREKIEQAEAIANCYVTPSPAARASGGSQSGVSALTQGRASLNPYAKRKTIVSDSVGSANTSAISATRRAQLQAAVLGPSLSTSSYPQRKRFDRQFGSALHVAGGEAVDNTSSTLPDFYDDDDEEDDALLSYVAFTKPSASSPKSP